MTRPAPAGGPPLRVAYLWNDAIVDDALLESPRPVVLGAGPGATFPLPDGVVDAPSLRLLAPREGGYRLNLGEAVGGAVWIGGVRHEVSALAAGGGAVDVGPDDHGVLTVGPVAVFFQHVRPARPLPRAWLRLDGGLVAGVGLAVFLATAAAVLAVLDARDQPPPAPLEVSPERVARYLVVPPEPPEPPAARETPAARARGLQRRDEAGGRDPDEGRAGRDRSRDRSPRVEGGAPTGARRVSRLGLLGALSGGGRRNAIAAALDAPSATAVLDGLGSARTVLPGVGGGGLRGDAAGSGEVGAGSLFAAGALAPDDAGERDGAADERRRAPRPRAREEVRVQVSRGRAATRGGALSRERIDGVVRANTAAIKACYEIEVQRQPGLEGRVEIQFRIGASGRVSTARVASSTLRNPRAEGCMVRQVKRWRFPEPEGGDVIVAYPFVLRRR